MILRGSHRFGRRYLADWRRRGQREDSRAVAGTKECDERNGADIDPVSRTPHGVQASTASVSVAPFITSVVIPRSNASGRRRTSQMRPMAPAKIQARNT
jgi:hypothetical protein